MAKESIDSKNTNKNENMNTLAVENADSERPSAKAPVVKSSLYVRNDDDVFEV